MGDALHRGSAEGANCDACPFARDGQPDNPVVAEFPDDPMWIVIGEGPGYVEARTGKPFQGPTGQVVNQILHKIGRPREHIAVTNATLCLDGRTSVRLGDGSLGRIDQLVGSKYSGLVQSIAEDGSTVLRRVIGWYKNQRGSREMREVTTRWAQKTGSLGRCHTTMTEDHPVLTPDGWRPAAEVDGGLIATGDLAPRYITEQIALGTLLGDGTLQRGSLIVRHAVDQTEYAKFKMQALSGLGVGLTSYPPRGNQVQHQIGFRTRSSSWGHSIRSKFYPDGKKRIPPEIISKASLLLFAIWYLDDGSMCHRDHYSGRRPCAEICGAGFPEDDLRAAITSLRSLGFDGYLHNGRIKFGVEATAKFSQAIARFVPSSMDYKLRPEDRGLFDPTIFAAIPASPFFDLASSLCVTPHRKREESAVYCLEVEDTHNFVTPAAVVHNCMPPSGSPVEVRERAAECCKPRLQAELAQWPGKPVLTLGAVAARALIPKEILDAIDPPDVPKNRKRQQKDKQKAERKAKAKLEKTEEKQIYKIAKQRFSAMIKIWRDARKREVLRQYQRKITKAQLDQELEPVRTQIWNKAWREAPKEWEATAEERRLAEIVKKANKAKKPAKKKPIKITDIVGTLFDIDVDGSGVRPLVPAIHPAALLRGGGATIGGSHTPDMAFINIIYDAAKIDALAKGKDVRLKINVEIEVEDAGKATSLFLSILQEALEERSCSIDLETYVDDPDRHHALMTYVAKIRVIGIATTKRSVSVAWDLLPAWCWSYFQLVVGKIETCYHNCLTEDSRVWLPDGRRVRIGQLVKQRYKGKVLTVNEKTGEIESRRVVDWIKGPLRPWADWMRIRVKGKGCLRLTCDHKVITARGRVRADEIKIGDRIFTTRSVLTDQQEALIYGSLLGDASITLAVGRSRKLGRRRSPYFRVAHDQEKQESYARFKASVLGDMVSRVTIESNSRGFSAGLDKYLIRVETKGDPRLHEAWRICTREGKKRITTEWLDRLSNAAFAIWYCDDGTLAKTSPVICVEAFGVYGAKRLAVELRSRGWPARIELRKPDNKLYLRITGSRGGKLSDEMDEFWRSIAPYIPWCMRRKLPERYHSLIDKTWWSKSRLSRSWADEVVEIGPLLRSKNSRGRYKGYTNRRRKFGLPQYCLVVEGNRNFFAEGLAVSNCIYDRSVLRAYGFVMPIEGVDENAAPFQDSLLQHHAAFPGNSHRLQTVTAQFFGIGPWKAEHRNQDETPERLAIYNAKDTGATHALIPALAIHVKRSKTEVIYERDKRMADIASRMHLAGMPVSREVNSQLIVTFTRLATEARRIVDEKANDPKIKDAIKHHLAIQLAGKQRKADSKTFEDRYELRLADLRQADWRFNVNTPKHIAALLQGMGVQLYQMTEGGSISTKKDVLEELADVGIVRDILKFRENDKMLDFVGPIFDQVYDGKIVSYGFADENDRIHPIWSTTKISGRWAGSEPHGISNPPREKVKKVPAGTTLPMSTIVVDYLCKKCNEPKDKHVKIVDHLFELGFLVYAERPTTKRQFVCRPGRKIVGFDFCVAPDTRVLTAGLRWIPISSIKVGDELVGFDEQIQGLGHSHRFKGAVVEAKRNLTQLCARITTDRGTVVASLDHRFVRRSNKRPRHWVRVTDIKVGDHLIYFTDPWPDERSWETGYVSGFLDGEGWISGSNTVGKIGGGAGFGQNEGPTLDGMIEVLRRRGYDLSFNKNKAGCVRVLPCGEWQSARFIGEFQPSRLLPKSRLIWEGRRTWSTNSRPAIVQKIEFIGEHPVVAIRTSTKTFIAEGFFSHNSQIEARCLAIMSGDPFMCEVFATGKDLHKECARVVFPGFDDLPSQSQKQTRTVCKTLEYATFYGAMDETVWKGLLKEGYDFKLADVSKSLAILRHKMAGIVRWQAQTILRASQPPYELRDFVDGRRRVWPMGQVEQSQALNIVPQATGAAIMARGFEKMDMRLANYREAFPIVQIHDAAAFECWEDDAEKVLQDINECFPAEFEVDGRTIRFPVEAAIGDSLADV